jgi:hypothetical protein
MSATLHPADLDKETRYELGKLRILHDKWVHTDYQHRGIAGAFSGDPELVYHLDAQDAILELINPDIEP